MARGRPSGRAGADDRPRGASARPRRFGARHARCAAGPLAVVYTQVATEAIADIPVNPPLEVSLEDWERGWTSLAECTFLALAGDEVVGCAGLMLDPDRPDRAEHSLTAVRRPWRGRGVAKALKQATIAWAGENGIRELYTWTQRGNEPMRRLNERLGYVVRNWCTSVRGPVSLR
ncbi:MAG: GNAT family N-acetyltransferase [Actinobacteria bacterium]|nr:MAG: GNAT family N-acetyltransferase [Actinomycetota bacterium]